MATTTSRPMTGQRAARILMSTNVAKGLGATTVRMAGRGSTFIRDNGTEVRIFNVELFATREDQQEALKLWKAGVALETEHIRNGGEPGSVPEEADELYKEALNKRMSFSVLAENAADFEAAFEVAAMLEMAHSERQGKEVPVLNRVRPIAVKDNTEATSRDLFAEELKELEAAATPAPAPTGKTTAGRRATAGR